MCKGNHQYLEIILDFGMIVNHAFISSNYVFHVCFSTCLVYSLFCCRCIMICVYHSFAIWRHSTWKKLSLSKSKYKINCHAHGIMPLAQDSIHCKMSLTHFPAHGSAHCLNNILPCAGKCFNDIMPWARRYIIKIFFYLTPNKYYWINSTLFDWLSV